MKEKSLSPSLSPSYKGEGEIPFLIPLPQWGRGQGEGETRRRSCVRRESYHGDDRTEIDAGALQELRRIDGWRKIAAVLSQHTA